MTGGVLYKSKAHRRVEQVLRETGLPYVIESGGRHKIVRIEGVQVLVFSEGQHDDADGLHLVSLIRQFVKRRGGWVK